MGLGIQTLLPVGQSMLAPLQLGTKVSELAAPGLGLHQSLRPGRLGPSHHRLGLRAEVLELLLTCLSGGILGSDDRLVFASTCQPDGAEVVTALRMHGLWGGRFAWTGIPIGQAWWLGTGSAGERGQPRR